MQTQTTPAQPRSTVARTAIPPAIAYEWSGAGEALVFVHGIGGNRSNWRRQMASFAADYRVVALDLRGYGTSDGLDAGLRFADFVADIERVLDALGIARAHLVGLSMGGLVVQAFYATYPQRVLSLTLAACRPGNAPVAEGESFARKRLDLLKGPRPTQALADAVLPPLMGPDATPQMYGQMHQSIADVDLVNYRKVLEVRAALPPLMDPRTIAVPTLVLGGRDDPLAPPSQMAELAAGIPGSELHIFERCGHFANVEKPDAFDARLRQFLAQQRAPLSKDRPSSPTRPAP